MKRIAPCLWFDRQAGEAAKLYVGIFTDSRITATSRYPASASPRSRRPMRASSALLVAAACAASLALPCAAQSPAAPNVVAITPRLVTSGQPTAAGLAQLRAQGFEAVVYLAPPTVSDAVKEEGVILARQGITYVNIPVRFDNPTEADFQQFAAILRALGERKVLVHCQVNMRASSFVFLYRTTVLREDARHAYQSVSQVWTPHGPWRALIEEQLRKAGLEFELL